MSHQRRCAREKDTGAAEEFGTFAFNKKEKLRESICHPENYLGLMETENVAAEVSTAEHKQAAGAIQQTTF